MSFRKGGSFVWNYFRPGHNDKNNHNEYIATEIMFWCILYLKQSLLAHSTT